MAVWAKHHRSKSRGQAPKLQALPQTSPSTCNTRLSKGNVMWLSQLEMDGDSYILLISRTMSGGTHLPISQVERIPSATESAGQPCLLHQESLVHSSRACHRAHAALAEKPTWLLPFRFLCPYLPKANSWCLPCGHGLFFPSQLQLCLLYF